MFQRKMIQQKTVQQKTAWAELRAAMACNPARNTQAFTGGAARLSPLLFPRKFLLAALSSALMLTACSRPEPVAPVQAGATPAQSNQKPPASASGAAPQKPDEEEGFIASGPIVVENQVDVAAQHEGIIASLAADVGTVVRKGQLLATIDARQLAAEQDAQKAKVRSIAADVKNWEAETNVAEADRERAEGMWKSQLITKQDLEHARYKTEASKFEVDRERENLHHAEATLRSLQLEAAKSRIIAPFDGVVARRYVRVGQKVAKDDRLFWVSATGPLRVKFMLPEKYLAQVHRGSTIWVVPDFSPQEKHRARVILVSPVIDPSSSTIEMVAELAGAPGELRPGMTTHIVLDKNSSR